MKRSIVKGFTLVMLLLSLANCGKSGGGKDNKKTYYPADYNPDYGVNDYNSRYRNYYGSGYNGGNYCQQASYGCVQCYVPSPCTYGYYNSGCGGSGYGGGGYGGGYVYYDPYNHYGQGNQFYVNAGFSWGG